ncbi:MAG: TadE/TadG family type IV pilus assembly protein [Xanthobacteraceae bacterium]
MSATGNLGRRFAESTRGVAAVEFAMVLPVLAVMFLASFDGGRGIAVYMKVRAATYTVDAITNQYQTIHDTDMQAILGATAAVLAPYPSGTTAVTVTQIAIDASGNATVSWSDTQGGTAHTKGAPISVPSTLIVKSSYLIFGEVSYKYTPMFGYFGNGSAVNLSDNLYVMPRSVASITRISP